MKKILILAFFFMLFVGCSNQSPSVQTNNQLNEDPHPTQIMVDKFFSTYKEEGIVPAFTELLGSYSYFLDQKDGPFANLITKLQNETEPLGEFKGYEVISVKPVGNTVKLYSYIVKFKTQPLRFTFVFYNYDSWRLQEFQYDGNIIEDLKDMMKYRDVE